MKKCIIIPDSFKGTMTSQEVCDIMTTAVRNKHPDCKVICIPIADGGEGTVNCLLHVLDGKKIHLSVQNAFGEYIDSFYGKVGDLAIIEMAAAAGIVSNTKRDPLHASTFGVGELIDNAVKCGCRHITIGLGGSCTNDAGAGMACALGTHFYDASGVEFIPQAETLDKICHIDVSETRTRLEGVEINCMCDTTAKMYGIDGAAYIYAQQKGADLEMVKVLDKKLSALASVIASEFDIDVQKIPGGGAAGALGAGAAVFLGAKLNKGINIILDMVGFDDLLEDCDMVFTGEGKFDFQSLTGKVVDGVAEHARAKGIPVTLVAGRIEMDESFGNDPATGFGNLGIVAACETSTPGQTMKEIQKTCRIDLYNAMQTVL